MKKAPWVVRKQFDDQIGENLDHRTFGQSRKNKRMEFLIQWNDKPITEATWERGTTLWQFEEQIGDYLRALPTRTLASSGGGGLLDP